MRSACLAAVAPAPVDQRGREGLRRRTRRSPRRPRRCRCSGSGCCSSLGDRDHDAALARAVELGEHQPGDADARRGTAGPGRARSAPGWHRAPAAPRAARSGSTRWITRLHLLQLLHQMRLAVQPAGGVGEQHDRVPRARAACSASNITAPGSAPGSWAANCAPGALGPDLAAARWRRRGRCRPRRAARSGPHSAQRRASLPMVVVLPEPFTPTTRITKGCARRSIDQRLRAGREDLGDALAQRLDECVDVGELLARHALAQVAEDALRRLDADIRGDQARLELLQDGRIDLPAASPAPSDRW